MGLEYDIGDGMEPGEEFKQARSQREVFKSENADERIGEGLNGLGEIASTFATAFFDGWKRVKSARVSEF